MLHTRACIVIIYEPFRFIFYMREPLRSYFLVKMGVATLEIVYTRRIIGDCYGRYHLCSLQLLTFLDVVPISCSILKQGI